MSAGPFDIAIVGAGVVGTATALALGQKGARSLVVLEAEAEVAAHQTGHNSGVIHSGLYYKPGSLKAKNCVEGRAALIRFCEAHALPFDRCGKVVVATSAAELPALDELERRGRQNGLTGLRRLGPEELREVEPHVVGLAGLHVPQTGIIDYTAVTRKYAELIGKAGGEIRLGAAVTGCRRDAGINALVLETKSGEVRCRNLINCAGLQSDRVARLCGVRPGLRIVPFRGEYYVLAPEKHHLVKNLIYPVPDPRFPFLGVHFTRMIKGGVEAGPNAVLAFAREGYRKRDVRIRDVSSWLFYGGFWRMAFRYGRMGFAEMARSYSKRLFVRSLKHLIPELQRADVKPGGAGVRAQALDPKGKLVDDFHIVQAERMIHVLNAPSPAATASLAIGRSIAGMAEENFTFA